MSVRPSVVLTDVSFAWPDGAPILDDVTVAFGQGHTGLIGANGAGKSTLFRLIGGDLVPTHGVLRTRGDVGVLPQDLTLRVDDTVGHLMGIHRVVAAVRAVEAGSCRASDFDTIGDDWDIEARADAVLGRMGLGALDVDRPVSSLSGGEAMLVALAGLEVARTPIALLDEPTNNLDRRSRARLLEALDQWPGVVIVASHDTALLNRMSETVEIRDASLTVFGGPLDEYDAYVAREQAAAEQALRTAEQRLAVERRQREEAERKLARRRRYAHTDYVSRRHPKMVMKLRAAEAEVSAGKLRGEKEDRIAAAREARDAHRDRVRRDARISVQFPQQPVPSGRRLASIHAAGMTPVVLQGSERVALVGPNGIGKTRLLETLVHAATAADTPMRATPHTARIGYLPQRRDDINDDHCVLDAVRDAAPDMAVSAIRGQLARFLLGADAMDRRVRELSGGERFRVVLSRLILARPSHQLLVLDEPTNSLDRASVDELVEALSSFPGGLLVVSHDDAFLRRLGIDRWLQMDEEGITEVSGLDAHVGGE